MSLQASHEMINGYTVLWPKLLVGTVSVIAVVLDDDSDNDRTKLDRSSSVFRSHDSVFLTVAPLLWLHCARPSSSESILGLLPLVLILVAS